MGVDGHRIYTYFHRVSVNFRKTAGGRRSVGVKKGCRDVALAEELMLVIVSSLRFGNYFLSHICDGYTVVGN